MKVKMIVAALAVSLLAPAVAFAQAPDIQGSNPGIAVAGSASISDLPQPALKFLARYFKNVNVKKVKKEYTTGVYDVDLANGYEVEFDPAGKVVEIDAPDNTAMPAQLVRALVGHRMYDNLKRDGKVNLINSLDFTYNGGRLIKVETIAQTEEELVFDLNGNLCIVEVDD